MQVYLVANGVAYQVLRVANKIPVACVTFCIYCTIFSVQCTGIFLKAVSDTGILVCTCWIFTFAWGRFPMFGQYVLVGRNETTN